MNKRTVKVIQGHPNARTGYNRHFQCCTEDISRLIRGEDGLYMNKICGRRCDCLLVEMLSCFVSEPHYIR